MSDTVTESEDRVPGLGAIPLIGNLFKSRSGSRQKKNLLVFIRPNIMRDADATESASETKYNEVRQDQHSLNNGHIMLLPGQKQPVIPALPPGAGQPAPAPAGANPQGAVQDVPPAQSAPQSTPLPSASPAPAAQSPPVTP
jgi:general secretion pathway protein D